MRTGTHLLLAFEMPSHMGSNERRGAFTFDECLQVTPENLKHAGVYQQIAIGLIGTGERDDPWRSAGLARESGCGAGQGAGPYLR